MIVRTSDGAVLEFVWLERGGLAWSRPTALRFLSRFTKGREGLTALRHLFAESEPTGGVWSKSDETLLHRAAWLISTDHILVGQYRFGDRYPASGTILGSPRWSSVLYWRDNLDLERDRSRALQWVESVLVVFRRVEKARIEKKKDKATQKDEAYLVPVKKDIERMRAMTKFAPGIPDYDALSDLEFLEQVEYALDTRVLIAIYHKLPKPAEVSGDDKPGPDTPAPKPGGDKADEKDDDTFDPNHNGADQGNTNNNAADDGNPFTDICILSKDGA
jgi:hypothetical protein